MDLLTALIATGMFVAIGAALIALTGYRPPDQDQASKDRNRR